VNKSIELLIVTTKQSNLDFVQKMNLCFPATITNQNGKYGVLVNNEVKMIDSPTKGVGINRNIGLELSTSEYVMFVDDDMIFYDNANEVILSYLEENPYADVIIFNFDYTNNKQYVRSRMEKKKRIRFHNCLNFGICCTLVKTDSIRKNNIHFNPYLGGGCIYSCGEDSLFFLDCIRAKLRVYTCDLSIGMNDYRESTWFRGFTEKYFYDKGAWLSCAFPKAKHFIKWYFAIRFKKMTELSFIKIMKMINSGIKSYKHLKAYQE